MINVNAGLNKIRKATFDETFEVICRNIKIDLEKQRFVYFLDFDYILDTTVGYRYENLTPDYQKILLHSLEELKYPEGECTNAFCNSYNKVLEELSSLSERIAEKLEQEKDSGYEKKTEWFRNMRNGKPDGFEEAIQRMLFVNQIFWQCDHRLTGLGRWDSLLLPYYEKDLSAGRMSETEAVAVLEDLYRILHRYYEYKSNVLMGDTGQIFVVGGSKKDGSYQENPLTPLFIRALKNVQQPDPKVLLRVNRNIPRAYMEEAMECMITGIGAPLLANDDVIIPKLVEFGIEEEDAFQYTTSACWEPLIGGKSTSMNNMTTLNYMRALDNLLKREHLEKITSFVELKKVYYLYLKRNLNAVKRVLHAPRMQYNPLLSVFTCGCHEEKKDVSHGGAKYKDVGITTVGLGNLVNALLNIKKFVFEEKKLTLLDVKRMTILDYEGYEDVLEMILEEKSRYGRDDEETIALVNEITDYTAEYTKDFVSYLGGRLKFGLSAPSYIDAAREFPASFDGRRKGEPFMVHISNEEGASYTEILNFAGALDYDRNRFNGNVVDFMVSPDYIKQNKDKFLELLLISIEVGFFELQMNVVSSEILIEAKQNPQAYPNLIVRVWGFSAYFNELPEEYKDVLIMRALKNEGKV